MFTLGQIIVTPAALEMLEERSVSPESIIQRHVLGDWGDMIEADKRANDLAVDLGGRILSAYKLTPGGDTLWVTTDPDRNSTTIMLPHEH